MPELLLGIDVGRYSSKDVLVTADGDSVSQHVVEQDMEVLKPGGRSKMLMRFGGMTPGQFDVSRSPEMWVEATS